MTPTTEQRERVARARGWIYQKYPYHGYAWTRGHSSGNGTIVVLDECPDYETVPALNYELEVEAQLETMFAGRNGWRSKSLLTSFSVDRRNWHFADNPLTARFLAYLAWMEER